MGKEFLLSFVTKEGISLKLLLPLGFSLAVGSRGSHNRKRFALVAEGIHCHQTPEGRIVAPWSRSSAPALAEREQRLPLVHCGHPHILVTHQKKLSKIQAISSNFFFFFHFLTILFCLDPHKKLFLTSGNDHTVFVQY